MKRVYVFSGIVILIGVGFLLSFGEQKVRFQKPEVVTETVVEEKVVNHDELRVKKAQEAEMERIEKEAEEMKAQYLKNELDEIEGIVWREIAAEAEAKAIEKEKSSGVY